MVKGRYWFKDKVFATHKDAQNYALEIIESRAKHFRGEAEELGDDYKIKISIKDNYVILYIYRYSEIYGEYRRLETLKRSILEKEVE